MKNTLLSIALLLITLTTIAQTEKPRYKTAADQFVEHYNNQAYENIFNMFSAEMQAALPLAKTTEFLTGLKAHAGDIKEHTFTQYERGSYASYKTTFERAVFALNISLDDKEKINGLLVKPFEEKAKEEDIKNALAYSNTKVSKKQADIIFEKTKTFPEGTQIAFAIIQNGAVTYYGTKRKNGSITDIENSDKIFEIGSISKVFTATLLAQYIQEKKVKAKDCVSKYLPFELEKKNKISLLELANHTSGFPRLPGNLDIEKVDPNNPYKDYDENDLKNYFQEKYPKENNDKGNYRYSNLGSGTLGYILTRIEDKPYERLLQEKIFSKYNMNHSTARLDKDNPNIIPGQNPDGKEVPNWTFDVLAGAGGITSTIEDMTRFALAHFDTDDTALALTRNKTASAHGSMSIGMGWHILPQKSGATWHWHNGGTGGYTSSMVLDTDNKNGIILLSNISAFHPDMGQVDKLCFALMGTLEK